MISDNHRLSSSSLVNYQYIDYLLTPSCLQTDVLHLLADYLGT